MRLALTNIFYYLIACPEHLRRLRDELAKIDWRDYTSLARLDHLSAVIYETLRLNPPVPAAGLRITPPEGLTLSNTHVPGGTTVLVPHYSLFRGKRPRSGSTLSPRARSPLSEEPHVHVTDLTRPQIHAASTSRTTSSPSASRPGPSSSGTRMRTCRGVRGRASASARGFPCWRSGWRWRRS